MRVLSGALSLTAVVAQAGCTFPDILVDDAGVCSAVTVCTQAAAVCAADAGVVYNTCAQSCMRQGCRQGCANMRSTTLAACEATCESCACSSDASTACQQATAVQ